MNSRNRGKTARLRVPLDRIQRNIESPVGKRAVLKLDLARMRPAIRIAHRIAGDLHVGPRIIFDHELVLLLAGHGEFSFGDQRYPLSPHTLFFVPPFTPHAIVGRRCEHVAVHFDLAMNFPSPHANPARRAPYRVQFPRPLMFPRLARLSPQDGIEQSCLEIVRAFGAVDPLAGAEASAMLLSVLLRLLRMGLTSADPGAGAETDAPARGANTRGQSLARRGAAFINQHLADRFSAADLAEQSGLSESQFNRLFRRHIGYAPMEYLRRSRVQRARELLAGHDFSVKEVAVRTGFDDAYHFSRVFRQIAGLSPSAYRDAVLSKHRK